jgi:hypothetical protein
MNFLLFKKHNSPSESCSKFFYIICWWTFYWHWNNWIRNKNWFLNESKFNIILIYWNTYHTNLICFIINKSITSSTIETIKCTNISSISFINFLKVQKMIDPYGKKISFWFHLSFVRMHTNKFWYSCSFQCTHIIQCITTFNTTLINTYIC